jgi:hypothetical protein
MNIIALDIDDCIYESSVLASGIKSDVWNLRGLEINLWKLSKLIETTNSKVFITSSWSLEWELAPCNQIRLIKDSNSSDIFYVSQVTGFIQQYLGGHIIGLSSGDRTNDVISLDNGSNRIVCFDDWDYSSSVENQNVKFFLTEGALTKNILWNAQKFLNKI